MMMNTKILDNLNTFDYSLSAVIKPPFEDVTNREIKHKQTRIVVDSRDRDIFHFPTPAHYEVSFDDDIEEVTSADIVAVDVPFSAYMINVNNNALHVSFDSGVSTQAVSIEPGDYTHSELRHAVESALNALGTATFEVTYSSLKDNYTIWSDRSFSLIFVDRKGTMARVLGLSDKKNYVSTIEGSSPSGLVNVIKGEFRKNFENHKYLVLSIEQMKLNHSANSVLHNSVALVPRNYNSLNIYSPVANVRKTFNPPIARLSKLRITFKDFDGNLYDFQNHDHRLEIIFESHKHMSRYIMA